MSDETSATQPRLEDLAALIERSPVAAVLLDIDDQKVCAANDAVADLMKTPRAAIVGLKPTELWDSSDQEHTRLMVAAMAAGAVDSYRARRLLNTDRGVVPVTLSMRRMALATGDVGVGLLIPESEPDLASQSLRAFFGPDALRLMVGSIDGDGQILRVTPSCAVVLGRKESELVHTQLIELVHPDDVDALSSSLQRTRERAEGSFVHVRLRHGVHGWSETRCLFCPMTEHESPIMFVLAQRISASTGQGADQILALELQLAQFATLLDGDSWQAAKPNAVDATRFAALDQLPRRQREVVLGLLKGERIPAIAESMFISNSTARNHLSHVFTAFGVHSQAELLALLRSEPGSAQPSPLDPSDASGHRA